MILPKWSNVTFQTDVSTLILYYYLTILIEENNFYGYLEFLSKSRK